MGLVTALQIFCIGFSFGVAGPCLLTCAPILMTYVAASGKRLPEIAKDVGTFLAGRLFAYILLGFLAGLSAGALREFTGPRFSPYFRPLAGIISVILGVLVIAYRQSDFLPCGPACNRLYNFSSLFLLGFSVGIIPCAPLLALLFEITLISKNAQEGMSYGLAFGLGTFLSGFIVVGIITGILASFPAHILKSKAGKLIFRIACALLLILLGASLIIS